MIFEELRQKVVKAFDNDFIGDTFFSDEEIDELNKYVKSEYSYGRYMSPSGYLFYMCLTILIIAKSRNYGNDDESEESHYWKDVFGDILGDELIIPYNAGNIRLDTFFNNHGRIWLRDASLYSRRFKQTLLYNSFAPKYSLEAFVKLVFDAYVSKENITTGFFDDPYEVYKKPYVNFVNDFSNQLRGVRDLETSVVLYNQRYRLSAAMRHGFAQDQDKIARLVSRTVLYIRKYFHKEPSFDDTYFSRIVSDYLTKEKVEDISHGDVQKVERVRSILDWYAYYFWNISAGTNARLLIKMPLLKLDSIDQYENIRLLLSLGGRVVETKYLDIVGYNYNPHINPVELDVTKYLKQAGKTFDFKIEVFASGFDKPIFSTDRKSSLVRPYLIFTNLTERENKDEIINPSSYSYIQTIVPEGLIQDFMNSVTFEEALRTSDNVYKLRPHLNEYISFGDKTVYFIDASKETLPAITGTKLDRISFESSTGIKCKAYQQVKDIKIIANKDYYGQTDEYEISLTNIASDQTKTIRTYSLLMNDGLRKNGIVLSTVDYPELNKFGINVVEIVRCSDGKSVTKFSYFCGDFRVTLNEKGVTDNGVVRMTLEQGYDIILDEDYKISDKNVYYQLPFGTVIISLPYIEFKFEGLTGSENHFLMAATETKTIFAPKKGSGEILSLPACFLRIKNTSETRFKVYVGKKEIEQKDGCYYIGEYLKDFYYKSAKICISCLNLNDGSWRDYCIYELYSQECIDENGLSITYEDEQFFYQISGFVGESNPSFKIDIFDDENSSKEEPLVTNPLILDGLSGSFTIKGFKEGYYKLILKRMVFDFIEYKEGQVLLRKDVDGDEYLFGDVYKSLFRNSTLRLDKIPNLCKAKEMKEYHIIDISFFRHDIYPVFSGKLVLGSRKKETGIFFALKNEKSIILYSDYEKAKRLFFNTNTKEISTLCGNDCETIYSVYIEEED